MNADQQIMELVKKHNLINRTFEYFWCSYDSYLIEEAEEAKDFGLIDRDSVNVSLCLIAFKLRHFDENMKHRFTTICVTLEFQHQNNTQEWLGTYECLFFMNGSTENESKDGEVCDDFFWIE